MSKDKTHEHLFKQNAPGDQSNNMIGQEHQPRTKEEILGENHQLRQNLQIIMHENKELHKRLSEISVELMISEQIKKYRKKNDEDIKKYGEDLDLRICETCRSPLISKDKIMKNLGEADHACLNCGVAYKDKEDDTDK